MNSTQPPATLFAFGLNHKTAPVEIREKLFMKPAESASFLELVEPLLSECLVLSTCNRTEIYAVSDAPGIDIGLFKDLLINFKGARDEVGHDHFFELIACSACQQLFSVATSVDSKVVGDLQVLKQLRGAYSTARDQRMAGKILNQLLQRAFKLGKQTYAETSIHEGAVSVSSAAVELAAGEFGSLRGRSVLVLGAGEMARLTAEALLNKRVGRIAVSNRTRAHAEEVLAALEETGCEKSVVEFDEFARHLPAFDIVISSTGSEEPIIYKDHFETMDRKILAIDIAVPRDIDAGVAEHPNVVLKNIDDVNGIVNGNHERRLNDLPKVKKMIADEMVDFLTWYYTLPLMPEFEKTGTKPPPEQAREIVRIKEFLNHNVSEIHKLFTVANGNFDEDLQSHFALIERLQTMKAETFGAAVAA